MTGIIPDLIRTIDGIVNDTELAKRIVYAILKAEGGKMVWLPNLDTQTRPERNQSIRELFRAGATIRVLAGKFRLTECTIRRILAA